MSSPDAASPSHRLWIPAVLAVLAIIGIGIVQQQPELERNYRQWGTAAVILLTATLTLLWFLLLGRFRWKTRLIVLGLLFVVGFGGSKLLRLDGTRDGTGLPRLAWRWSAPLQASFTPPLPTPNPNSTSIAPNTELRDVPQFFGRERTGTVRDVQLSGDWSTEPPKQLWRQPIGAGWSSFAVVGGRAYTQEQRGEEELVTCYDALTGAILWSHADNVRFFQWQGGEGPRGTPAVLDGRVYTIGATGILQCLDAANGQRIWSRNTLEEHQLDNLTWGVSCSPLVFGGTVVVTGGQTAGPTVLAYRRTTGEPLWKAGTDKSSYASPTLATLGGQARCAFGECRHAHCSRSRERHRPHGVSLVRRQMAESLATGSAGGRSGVSQRRLRARLRDAPDHRSGGWHAHAQRALEKPADEDPIQQRRRTGWLHLWPR
jgi:outer membrane protein assembly factor BamB